jgi:hypothetical protein
MRAIVLGGMRRVLALVSRRVMIELAGSAVAALLVAIAFSNVKPEPSPPPLAMQERAQAAEPLPMRSTSADHPDPAWLLVQPASLAGVPSGFVRRPEDARPAARSAGMPAGTAAGRERAKPDPQRSRAASLVTDRPAASDVPLPPERPAPTSGWAAAAIEPVADRATGSVLGTAAARLLTVSRQAVSQTVSLGASVWGFVTW